MRSLGILALLGLIGCSTFDRDWDAYREANGTRAEGRLWGCWEGTWHSDVNGHEGSLRCIFGSGSGPCEARFYATYRWWGLGLTFEYTLPITAVASPGEGGQEVFRLRGDAELECFVAAGRYACEGRVEGDRFIASYRSSLDRGVFRMKFVK